MPMIKKLLSVSLYVVFILDFIQAKPTVDCRVMTSSITECNPYGHRLHYAKEIVYDVDRLKLIIEKTLPVPKKHSMKVVSVSDMLEHYVKVEESVRFKGNDSRDGNATSAQAHTKRKVKLPKVTFIPYTVVRGDSLSKIAKRFGLKPTALASMNGIRTHATLQIGQRLKLVLAQDIMQNYGQKKYVVQEGDSLLSIAKKFNISPKALVLANRIKDATAIQKGKVLKLPFGKVVSSKVDEKSKSKNAKLDIRAFGSRSLRVTATAYTSHGNQTDSTPFLAAWNNHIHPGMKIIAVSRDLLTRFGMRNGTRVRIGGLRGYYRVRDKMNKRYRKRIDIYMGLDLRRALRWGRRSVVIYW